MGCVTASCMGLREDLRVSRAPAAGFVAMGMVWAAFAAQVPVLKAQINASDAAFGLSFLVSSIGSMMAMWLSPKADRWFGALSLAVASAAMGACFVIPAMAPSLVAFTFGMFLASAASGVLDVLMNARISEIEAETRRPLMNLNHAIFSFGYAACALATGFAREAGWGPVPIFVAVAVVVGLLSLSMRQPHSQVAGSAHVVTSGGGLFVWLGGIIVLVAFFSEQAVEGWSALQLERTLGGDAAAGAMGPAILGLTMGFGRLFGQALASRVADTLMIALACLISAAGLTLAAFASTLLFAYLGFGLMGLGISVVVPLAMALVGRMVRPERRVAALGQATVIGYIAFFAGPAVMGITSDLYGLPVAFLLVAVVLVLVALLVVPLMARQIASAERGGKMSAGIH